MIPDPRERARRGLVCAACLLVAASATAQMQWTDVGPSPVVGSGWGAAYDADRDRIVVFGNAETWEYDVAVWTRMQPARLPNWPGGIMTYDPGRRRTLLYTGGAVAGTELWEWDGQDWSLRNAPGPPVGGPALAYNAGRARVMLFGGGGLSGPSNDLWEWDGVSWQQVPASNPPPVSMPPATSIRYNTLAYAQDRDVLTVFGASTSSGMIGGFLPVT